MKAWSTLLRPVFLFFILSGIFFACTESGKNTQDQSSADPSATSVDSKPAKTKEIPKNGTVVKGEFPEAAGITVFIDQVGIDNTNAVLQKADTDNDGRFEMQLKRPMEPGLYRIRLGARKSTFPIGEVENTLNIKGDKLAEVENYGFTVDGSKGTNEFLDLMSRFTKGNANRDDVANYVKDTEFTMGALQATLFGLGLDRKYLDIQRQMTGRLTKAYPGSSYAKDYVQYVNTIERRIAEQEVKNRIAVGKQAPDIKLTDPNGKEFKLSDLKGKVVLLDFWASWCGPCRKANPQVVQLYDKYKSKGFTVYSVSLDGLGQRDKLRFGDNPDVIESRMQQSKQRWVKAIEQDQLSWPYHVSDLAKWDSAPAATYGVRSIPATFLIDKKGKIAAIKPRKNQLEQEIIKLL